MVEREISFGRFRLNLIRRELRRGKQPTTQVPTPTAISKFSPAITCLGSPQISTSSGSITK
jgi:hypothetical protein